MADPRYATDYQTFAGMVPPDPNGFLKLIWPQLTAHQQELFTALLTHPSAVTPMAKLGADSMPGASPLPDAAGAAPGTTVGADARGNPIVVGADGKPQLQPSTVPNEAAAFKVSQDGGGPKITSKLDMSLGAQRAGTPTQGAQDKLLASKANGGEGRTAKFYSDGVAIF